MINYVSIMKIITIITIIIIGIGAQNIYAYPGQQLMHP